MVKTERPEVVEIPAKLSEAMRAAELLARRYGLFSPAAGEEANNTPDALEGILAQLGEEWGLAQGATKT